VTKRKTRLGDYESKFKDLPLKAMREFVASGGGGINHWQGKSEKAGWPAQSDSGGKSGIKIWKRRRIALGKIRRESRNEIRAQPTIGQEKKV